MGLDMYLERCKRRNNATAREVVLVGKWLDWLNRGEEEINCPPCDWNGLADEDITDRVKELAELYQSDLHTCGNYYTYETLWEEVGYWRKANHIHNYFVENVQGGVDNCGTYEVSKEVLEDLLDRCNAVMEVKNSAKLVDKEVSVGTRFSDGKIEDITETMQVLEDTQLIEDILPTRGGFFFGGTDYDEWYFKSVEDTIDIVTRVLEDTDFDSEMVCYSASW